MDETKLVKFDTLFNNQLILYLTVENVIFNLFVWTSCLSCNDSKNNLVKQNIHEKRQLFPLNNIMTSKSLLNL